VLQPGYLPWLGFFDQLRRSDVFVHYDDVQYDKHGWRNRNRVKGPDGVHWLTVPVRHSGLDWPIIKDVEIDGRTWPRKHLGTIKHFYSRAPYLERYVPELEAVLERPWQRLADLNLALVDLVCSWLGLRPTLLRSSELCVSGARSERLVRLCQSVGATRYLSGSAARAYLDEGLFEHNGIVVEFQDYVHPTYPQQHGDFMPYLSTLDLVLNCGDDSLAIIASGSGSRQR
jgi:hypothetical protein